MPNFCPARRLPPAASRRRSAAQSGRQSAARPAADGALPLLPIRSTCFRSESALSGFRAFRNKPGEYRSRITRDRAGHAIDMHVENRQENADPHGRSADEFVVLEPRHLGDLAVGRAKPTSRHPAELAAADRGKNKRSAPSTTAGPIARYHQAPEPQRRERQQRPAHQLQFGQPPAGEGHPLAPAKRIVGRIPIARALVAAILQIAGIEHLVRAARAIASRRSAIRRT